MSVEQGSDSPPPCVLADTICRSRASVRDGVLSPTQGRNSGWRESGSRRSEQEETVSVLLAAGGEEMCCIGADRGSGNTASELRWNEQLVTIVMAENFIRRYAKNKSMGAYRCFASGVGLLTS